MKLLIQKLLSLFKKKVVKQVEEVKEKVMPVAPAQEKKKKKYYHPKPKKANL
jgi:hypothetical protein